MIEPIATGLDDRVLGLRINGAIESADLDVVAIAFKKKVARYRRVRIYVEVRELGPISPPALFEDLRLALDHFRNVEREAIVADADWLALLARAGNLLPGIQVRRFSWWEKGKALAWING